VGVHGYNGAGLKQLLPLTVSLLGVLVVGCQQSAVQPEGGQQKMSQTSVWKYTADSIDGQAKPLADYQGQVLLIVNVASQCGFTPQYKPMEELYQKYRDRGFRILAFPANNFGAQEPGTNEEIKAFCASKYHVTFDLFSKISVKGADIHPLYKHLTGGAGFDGDITWNFNKFLVDGRGQVVARYGSKTEPLAPELVATLERLLTAP